MKLVIIESPFGSRVDGTRAAAEEIKENIRYARACVLDCLNRGESPYASHLFFTQDGLLDDATPEQRRLGMEAGFAWQAKADLVAVYGDLGETKGMREGWGRAFAQHIPTERRWLGGEWRELWDKRLPFLGLNNPELKGK